MDRDAIFVLSNKISNERYACDLYELNENRRAEVCRDAQAMYAESLAEHAERMAKAAKVRK